MDMRNDIRSCRKAGGERNGLPWSRYEFSAGFAGFAGHFPGMPVLPGVCMLKAAAVTLEDWHRSAIAVAEVSKARFSAPVKPGEPLEVVCGACTRSGREYTASLCFVTGNSPKPSACTLRYVLSGEPPEGHP